MTQAEPPRTRAERRADVLAKLSAPVADAWVATAGAGGPHLVPLTLAWHEERIVLASTSGSPTVRNLMANASARVALGGTRDVVMIEAVVDTVLPVSDPAAGVLGEVYAARNDWDPRTAGSDYVFVLLRPRRIQAWREVNELAGRTVMRDGVWLD